MYLSDRPHDPGTESSASRASWAQAALMLSLLQCIHDAVHPLYAPFVER